VLTTSSTINYRNSLYAGTLAIPASDTSPKSGDPRFVNPTVSGPYGTLASGPQLRTGLARRRSQPSRPRAGDPRLR
jgi:hypothetical protein